MSSTSEIILCQMVSGPSWEVGELGDVGETGEVRELGEVVEGVEFVGVDVGEGVGEVLEF